MPPQGHMNKGVYQPLWFLGNFMLHVVHFNYSLWIHPYWSKIIEHRIILIPVGGEHFITMQFFKKDNFYGLLKITTLLICMGFFLLNSWQTMEKYFQHESILVSHTQRKHHELPLPSFLLCNGSAFKKVWTPTIIVGLPFKIVRW